MIITQFIPDLVGGVVSKVNDVFSTRKVNPFNVDYDYGHDIQIEKNLSQKDQSVSYKGKYPLVWFVMNYKEKMQTDNSLYATVPRAQIYILMDSDPNYTMQERRDKTFLPILYPIYAELFNQLSKLYTGFVPKTDLERKHTKIDMPYWSKDGMSANFYTDFIDAIQIADLELEVQRKLC